MLTRNLRRNWVGDLFVPPVGSETQDLIFGAEPIAHHPLGRIWEPRWEARWEELFLLLRRRSARKVLLTTEELPDHLVRNPALYKRLGSHLSRFDDVRILCWLRRQDDYIASLYVEGVKQGLDGRQGGEPLHDFPDADYESILGRLSEALPHARIEARPYGRSNVIQDFIAGAGLTSFRLDTAIPTAINARVSPGVYRAQMTVNRCANAKGVDPAWTQSVLVQALRSASNRIGGPEAAVPITNEERAMLLQRFSTSNKALCSRFNLPPSHFDPSLAQAAAPYNVPERIPVAVADALSALLIARRAASTDVATDFLLKAIAEGTDH